MAIKLDCCVGHYSMCKHVYTVFLTQDTSSFMMLFKAPLDTPSYQLLVKPCLPYKLFLFFTLLFEKAAL